MNVLCFSFGLPCFNSYWKRIHIFIAPGANQHLKIYNCSEIESGLLGGDGDPEDVAEDILEQVIKPS